VTAAPAGDATAVVAAFDLDGTLTRGGSVWQFLSAVRGRRAVIGAGVRLLPKLVRGALVGGPAADEGKEALFVHTLAGLDARSVERQAAAFGRAHWRRRRRADMAARLRWHRDRGHRIVVVSASPEYYVRAIGDELGVDGVVATRLAVDDGGRLTGHYDGGNCRGEQKRARVLAWMASRTAPGDARPLLWAYGNSAGDRSLLEAADVGVDVGRLGRLGKLRRFPRLDDVASADPG